MQRMQIARLLAGIVTSVGLCSLCVSKAHADVITHLNSVSGSNGAFTWSYDPSVTVDHSVMAGDYFELVDFKGFNGQHSEPAGWSFSTSGSGPVPAGMLYPDDPSAPNLVWQYTGSTPLNGHLDLGTFTAGSTVGTLGTGVYAAQSTRSNGIEGGSKASNQGFDTFPMLGGRLGAALPEPAPLLLLVVGLPFLLPRAWKRQARTSEA